MPSLVSFYSNGGVGSFVSINAMVHYIQPSYVWVVALRYFHMLNWMYNLSPTTIMGMIYGVSCH